MGIQGGVREAGGGRQPLTTSLHTELNESAAWAGRASDGATYIGLAGAQGWARRHLSMASDADLKKLRLIIAVRVPIGIAALVVGARAAEQGTDEPQLG